MKLKNNVRVPKLDDDESFLGFFFKAFGAFGCFAFTVWAVGSLASLALIGALIYFLIRAAGTF